MPVTIHKVNMLANYTYIIQRHSLYVMTVTLNSVNNTYSADQFNTPLVAAGAIMLTTIIN
jgi:hypothetical protein